MIIKENEQDTCSKPRISTKKETIKLLDYEMMESYFKTKSIFDLLGKWKWHILIITVVAGALGAVFSAPYFIHPKYKSTATVYPANITCLSDESESEQMLEILGSRDIMFKIIEQYDLYTHYGIDPSATTSLAKMMSYYDENVIIEKTPNDAINITVCDEDPQIASDIANSIIEIYDKMMLNLNSLKSGEIYEIYSCSAKEKEKAIDSLSNVLKKMSSEYGLIDMKSQVKAYSEAAAQGRSLGEAHSILDNWQTYGPEYNKTDSLLFNMIKLYEEDVKVFETAKRDMTKIQTYSHVISKPFPADKKFYPVRWLMVLLAALGGCLIGIIAVAIIESCRKAPEVDTKD